jgi:predicted phosphodiesterase
MVIEQAIAARAGGVTLRMYGHTHTYRKIDTNAVITGNAGAPLDGSSTYGFALVTQRADGDIVITQYEIGRPPMAMLSFVVHPDGTLSH